MLKQVFIGILAVFLMFSLTGCGGEQQPEVSEDEQVQEDLALDQNITPAEEAQDFLDGLDREKDTLDMYKEIIASSINPADCMVIQDDYYLTACKNQVIINSVKANGDTSLCDQIEDEQIKIDCKMIEVEN